jgi:hypothetical protein
MQSEVTNMKPSIAFVLLFLLTVPVFTPALTYSNPDDYMQWTKPKPYYSDFNITWTMISSPSVSCSNTAGVFAGYYSYFYQICGNDASLIVYPYIQRRNWDSWSVLSALHPGGGVYNHSAAYITDKIVVSGGNTSPGNYYDYTTVYNTSANTWLQSTPMPQAHMINTAMVSNGTNICWLLGGEIGGTGTVLNTVYKWSPDDLSMQTMAPMPAPRKDVAAAYFWNKIYVFGGASSGNVGTNSIWLYDCLANSWSVVPMLLAHARTGAAAIQALYTDIFVIGGQNGSNYLNSVERYRPEDNTLIDVAPMLFATAGMAAGGEGYGFPKDEDYECIIYVSGGYNGSIVTLANRAMIENGAVEASSLGNIKALFH